MLNAGLDLARFAAPAEPAAVHVACHAPAKTCAARALRWPAGACWLDDQVAVGLAAPMTAFERLYPNFWRFAWWFPLEIDRAMDNFPERILLAHVDWLARAAPGSFAWDARAPADGPPLVVRDIDHTHRHHLATFATATRSRRK